MRVTRLQVLRDLYYTSKNNSTERAANSRPQVEYVGFQDAATIQNVLRNPSTWNSPLARQMFASRDRDESYVFRLEENQLLPMGDNSPQSSDARIWNGDRFVDDSYLLGEALFIYWPHAKTKPLPFWPNFERMKLIR
jgi:signal peptidase I